MFFHIHRYYVQQFKYGAHGDEKNSFVLEDRRTKRTAEVVQTAM